MPSALYLAQRRNFQGEGWSAVAGVHCFSAKVSALLGQGLADSAFLANGTEMVRRRLYIY